MNEVKVNTPDILQRIIQQKVEELVDASERLSLAELSRRVDGAPAVRPFLGALQQVVAAKRPAVIAEIKKASPSRGVLRENFNPRDIALTYADHGATCLSVLTDRNYFQGCAAYLEQARDACTLPVLRKDFIIDPYQVYEARLMGADCILLIVAVLGDVTLRELMELSHELGMDVLVEVHDAGELERALAVGARLIGINNRNLRSFETRLETTEQLAGQVPEGVLLVSESGIQSRADVNRLIGVGVGAFLIGETFMRADDPGVELARLFDSVRLSH